MAGDRGNAGTIGEIGMTIVHHKVGRHEREKLRKEKLKRQHKCVQCQGKMPKGDRRTLCPSCRITKSIRRALFGR